MLGVSVVIMLSLELDFGVACIFGFVAFINRAKHSYFDSFFSPRVNVCFAENV